MKNCLRITLFAVALILLSGSPLPVLADSHCNLLIGDCNVCRCLGDCLAPDVDLPHCVVPSASESRVPSWEGIIHHYATPIRIFDLEWGLDCYYVGAGQSHFAGLLPHVQTLANWYPPGTPPVLLDEGPNTAIGMPVRVVYLPDNQLIRVDTFYADGKPYIFTIDVENTVEHLAW